MLAVASLLIVWTSAQTTADRSVVLLLAPGERLPARSILDAAWTSNEESLRTIEGGRWVIARPSPNEVVLVSTEIRELKQLRLATHAVASMKSMPSQPITLLKPIGKAMGDYVSFCIEDSFPDYNSQVGEESMALFDFSASLVLSDSARKITCEVSSLPLRLDPKSLDATKKLYSKLYDGGFWILSPDLVAAKRSRLQADMARTSGGRGIDVRIIGRTPKGGRAVAYKRASDLFDAAFKNAKEELATACRTMGGRLQASRHGLAAAGALNRRFEEVEPKLRSAIESRVLQDFKEYGFASNSLAQDFFGRATVEEALDGLVVFVALQPGNQIFKIPLIPKFPG